MIKIISLLCCALILSDVTYAQISIGPIAGANITKYRFTGSGGAVYTGGSAIDFRVGALADVALTGRWHLQPGILYSSNGHNVTGTTSSYVIGKFNINAIEIPAYFTYKTQQKNGGHFFFSAGPYLAVNIKGTMHVTYTDYAGNIIGEADVPMKIGYTHTLGYSTVKRFVGGAGANVGYELKGGFSARVHFQKGLINMWPQPNAGSRSTSYNGGVTLAYLFPLKKDKKGEKK